MLDLPAQRHMLNEQIHQAFDAFAQFVSAVKTPFSMQEEFFPTEHKLRLLEEHLTHVKWKEEVLPSVQKLIELLKNYYQGLCSLENDLKQ